VFLAVGLHEYAKALVAYRLGDKGVRTQGRLTINPLKHMDALGSIFMAVWGYGWSNPTRITPFSFANKRKAMIIIFAVPFLANIIMGMMFAVAASAWARYMPLNDNNVIIVVNVYIALLSAARLNISFALFNVIPIYPLDGLLLLTGISQNASIKVLQAERILQIVLAFFIILGGAAIFFNPLTNLILSVF
jgi:Zn-dependent protease